MVLATNGTIFDIEYAACFFVDQNKTFLTQKYTVSGYTFDFSNVSTLINHLHGNIQE